MQNNPWDERYSIDEYYYGENPNEYLKENLLKLNPGKILFPGEGEGRNAVYAAELGFEVTAFDSSSVAKEKALRLAGKNNVAVDYRQMDYLAFINNTEFNDKFNYIALIFTHCQPEIRTGMHKKLAGMLLPGGIIILETFNKMQIRNASGGPNDVNLLFSKEDLIEDFSGLDILFCEELQTKLYEGPHHEGTADVLRLIGRKQ